MTEKNFTNNENVNTEKVSKTTKKGGYKRNYEKKENNVVEMQDNSTLPAKKNKRTSKNTKPNGQILKSDENSLIKVDCV